MTKIKHGINDSAPDTQGGLKCKRPSVYQARNIKRYTDAYQLFWRIPFHEHLWWFHFYVMLGLNPLCYDIGFRSSSFSLEKKQTYRLTVESSIFTVVRWWPLLAVIISTAAMREVGIKSGRAGCKACDLEDTMPCPASETKPYDEGTPRVHCDGDICCFGSHWQSTDQFFRSSDVFKSVSVPRMKHKIVYYAVCK